VDTLFLYRVIISFFIAGIWIATVTLLAERMGSKMGGLFTNLPSNILISLLFVAMAHGTTYVVESMPGIPIGMAINTPFLFILILTLRFGLLLSIILSLGGWLGSAYMASLINLSNLWFNCFIYALLTVVCFLILEKVAHIPSTKKSIKKYTKLQLGIRAAFAGGIVAAIIVSSKFLNPYVFGIFSTFPAVLLSTMVILVINQDSKFAQATGKILILSSSNIVVYALVVYFTFNNFGFIWGTVLAFWIAFAWVWIFHPVLNRIK